jgi:lipoprotein-anchoring transpeptidase ErfK/SrfK
MGQPIDTRGRDRGRAARARRAGGRRARAGRARALLAGAALAVSLLAAACASGGGSTTGSGAVSPSPAAPPVPPVRITVRPGSGNHAKPQHGLSVHVRHGTLVSVDVETTDDAVTGDLNAKATAWHSRWPLQTATLYTVRVTALDTAGRTVTRTRAFRTLTPKTTFSTQIFEGKGVTYGVGMPVMLTFSRPIENKKAVERSLRLWASRRIVGAWYWDGDSALYFRPRSYWPQNVKVRFVGHLDGVEGAPGVYGVHKLRQDWRIGESLIAVASTRDHHVRIYRDRRLWATWPCSTGRPGKDTPNGTYLTIEKHNPQHMVGPGYDLQVPWSVRFTWSGDFMHDASWSVGVQGAANVSHGCVNLSPEHARTYYELSVPGDPVTVTGSPRAGKWDDGWTVWFLSWKQLVHGSALHKAVRVGPDGSEAVSPSQLNKSHARAPVGRPKPGNALAS